MPYRVPEFVGLSFDEIRALRELKLFPKPKGTACAPWYPSKQLAAYSWALHHRADFAEAVSFVIGRRDPAWARENPSRDAYGMYDYDHPEHPINET